MGMKRFCIMTYRAPGAVVMLVLFTIYCFMVRNRNARLQAQAQMNVAVNPLSFVVWFAILFILYMLKQRP